ncbi:hypothetical protein COCC4DRAFT_139119 [Bipolaris maydis ATCC 48331]|uniref:Zn(2)-C6 fungal-type domain-containing protein n=2 Tax=Cochliobolus heterostrophus TaxID=5016 RepID=M2UYS7_COCH5|nr:uncharacterized protein COCC4DRAFT_139119 [Bipolaris maydis ATCC 48331]EMD92963.1 hypothetical protein COCHEDRAFT_1172665 [Bipolaris maydis C5]KAJ5025972.1 hypothetical protein J3E73DRAFT_382009 [Bipolaris maydis]ENI04650.1 hypothetical protein COCC4DRAFT_139119 [Bipolaris maydis ATCC 48331]KAJ6208194.1 hypothetical protein PSV09DRAFT_1172665 [Bipolaris maydis]KAJ6270183.1 hypothetical protein PSV08DRAFT_362738 [Bipolaris maydis]
MDQLEDELDLRYHKGLDPDVYYRCPTLESLAGALRNEVDKNASSFIPTHVVTEFVFAPASTITIPVTQQPNLDILIEPADHLQTIAVEHALCKDIHGKQRLQVQRAIARAIMATVQETDSFAYSERSALNKDGGDGVRFRYVCLDSMQNRYRKSNKKKDMSHDSDGSDVEPGKNSNGALPTYDCGGAVHIKFSLKREAINVVYKHNPIHTARPASDSPLAPAVGHNVAPPAGSAHEKPPRKKRRGKEAEAGVENEHRNTEPGISTSPIYPRPSAKKRKKEGAVVLTKPTSPKQSKKAKSLTAPVRPRKNIAVNEESRPPLPVPDKACIRCHEKKIKCDKAQPACDQCRRGLWTCQYGVLAPKKQRTKNGCLPCKERRRKCTEENPSCAYCLRTDSHCEYAAYSSVR